MQVAIVTGASSGIGFGCATKLADMGMAVARYGTRRGQAGRLGEDHRRRRARRDPRRRSHRRRRAATDRRPGAVERWGHIDFLINNAGVGSPKPLHETDDESLDYFLGLMLRAPFRLARDVIPHMQPGSAIINVTSTFAVVGGLRGGAYSAAKGGLTALTTHIACQYGPQGIRCNAVAPGVTLTPMVAYAAGGRAVPQDQHRDDAISAAGQGRRHREHGGVSVFGGRQFHQRPDDRGRWRLEFDEVSVGLRADVGMGRRVEPVRTARPGRCALR